MCNEINVVEEIRELESLIEKYSKKVNIYNKLKNLFNFIFLLSPILIISLLLFFNFLHTFSIISILMILTKYLQLRTNTLYWINFSALYGFNEYKKELIEEYYN